MQNQRSVQIFDNTIHSKHTLKLYRHNLGKFRKFTKIESYDSLLRVDSTQLMIILQDYVLHLKDNISPNTIPVAFAPVEKFLIANGVELNFRRIRMLFPAKWRKAIAYARERQYDGLIDDNYVFLFSNESISSVG